MKKFLSLLFVLMLASSTAMAAEKKSSKSKDKKVVKKEEKKQSYSTGGEKGFFVLQLAGDLTLQGSNMNSNGITFNGVGFGFELSGSYAFNENFSLGLMTGVHAVDTSSAFNTAAGLTGGNWSYAPTEVVAQYNFTGSSIKPYLLFGLGIANHQVTFADTTTYTAGFGLVTESELIFSPGIGMAFEVGDNANFFVQLRIDILSPSVDWKADWSTDAIFIPFQVGFNFGGI